MDTGVEPGPIAGGRQDRIADLGGLVGVSEGRRTWHALVEGLDEVRDLMDEAVLVADAEARHPPSIHVRLIAIGDMDVPHPLTIPSSP